MRLAGNKSFPQSLMAILDDDTVRDIITWLPEGRSFVILRPDLFDEEVIPKYLVGGRTKSLKYTSFMKRLNRW